MVNSRAVPGEATPIAKRSVKRSGGRDSAPNPTGNLTALPKHLSWWGEARGPSSDLTPVLGLQPRFSGLAPPPISLPALLMFLGSGKKHCPTARPIITRIVVISVL